MYIVFLLFGIASGFTVVLSRTVNAELGKRLGIYTSSFYNFFTGVLLSFLVFLCTLFLTSSILPTWQVVHDLPLIYYLGGLVGIIVVTLLNIITPRIPAFHLTLLSFLTQLFVGILIDYFASGTYSFGKVIGGFLVFIGLSYNLLVDRHQTQAKS